MRMALDKVGELAADRNVGTYAPLSPTLATRDVFPQSAFGSRLAQKLNSRDVLAEYRWLKDTAILLRDHCGRLCHAMLLRGRGHRRQSDQNSNVDVEQPG
jgi:hypothetical protein